MITFITVIHISAIVLLVIAVLLQSGKGAEISANFGGSSQTVFGSSGGANFFQKMTYGLAGVFMLTSLTLTILPGKLKKSVFEGYNVPATPGAPVAPAQPAAPATGAAGTAPAEAVKANTAEAPAPKDPTTPLGAVHSKNNGGNTLDTKATNTAPAAQKAAEQKK